MTVTAARQDFFHLVRKSVKGHVPVRITSKEGDAALIFEADYESLLETLELLSLPGLRKSIAEARADIRAGRTKPLRALFGG